MFNLREIDFKIDHVKQNLTGVNWPIYYEQPKYNFGSMENYTS